MNHFFTLTSIGHAEISNAEFLDVLFQSYALSTGVGLADKRLNRREVLPGVGAGFPVIIESASRLSGKTYGTLWSTVARVQSGRRTARLAFRLTPMINHDAGERHSLHREVRLTIPRTLGDS